MSARDEEWAKAKRFCRLSAEDVRMARDLDLRPYYDFSGGVRGRYCGRFAGSCKVVELEPDVARRKLSEGSSMRRRAGAAGEERRYERQLRERLNA